MKWLIALAVLAIPGLHVKAAKPVPVEIRETESGFVLYRGGEPYEVRGAGTQMVDDIASLQAAGGNSIRTWTTDVGPLLDRAHELGITVSLCLNVMRERHGFDYDDAEAVARQFEAMKQEVLKYKDHPALLTWIIGNELNHDYTNSRVYDAVNDISKMIHELDPFHPTTTATADMSAELLNDLRVRADDLDFISVQVYGGINTLPERLSEYGLAKPLMLTEWGTKGHWEVDTTLWGAPLEFTSSEKAEHYRMSYETATAGLGHLLIGNYVFLWGHKQERTPTWYGMLFEGGTLTESVDVMRHIWTGSWPENRVPVVEAIYLNGQKAADSVSLDANKTYQAKISVTDPERGDLDYRWVLLRESEATQSGGDKEEVPEELSQYVIPGAAGTAQINVPLPGKFRIFSYVSDSNGGLAHANLPFKVVGAE